MPHSIVFLGTILVAKHAWNHVVSEEADEAFDRSYEYNYVDWEEQDVDCSERHRRQQRRQRRQ